METTDAPATSVPRIPGYTPSRHLGSGGSSAVWLASRDKDGARFAIKCVTGALQGDQRSQRGANRETALREVRILSALRHEHLIRIHDVVELGGEARGSLGLVMDFAAGGSLTNLVKARRQLSVGETVTVLTPVAQVLAYLHAQGTAHGDISPGNVLFTAQGKPLVTDLGVAGVVGEENQSLDVGTDGFVDTSVSAQGGPGDGAREALQPERDVYSLAALGWYCLTGMAPEIAKHRPPLPLLVPDVPKGLAAALEAGLDPDPRARPTARELGTAVYRSAAAQPVDLAGSVHSSVIPELLTRRQAGGRPQRRSPLASAVLRLRPLRTVMTPRPERRTRKRKPQRGPRIAIRVGLLVAAGVSVGAVGWAFWLGVQEPASGSTSVVISGTAIQAPQADQPIPDTHLEALRSEDPIIAVHALSAVRDMALGLDRLELLANVNAAGSPAQAADETLKQQLGAEGIHFAGLTTSLSSVSVLGPHEVDRAVVALTATTSGYEERDRSDRLVKSQPAGEAQQLRLVLVRLAGQWSISEILGPG
ncbi:serine/threonine-protein kinase [Paenarthrobacter aromaticivorans]|uniref:non-specific serine/threonine protein kinase n=1 Tax=Paenarthrobacter aromaticivorans TaxID=2849150 RepID=A0ABS6I4V4_9MICC|nr:serine/threonine-protein kinase [Paenarthrobacter sp. MMS21-TAE1-1]MBU8865462.1 serine/threonine protein kinase [Paenarthrobacter sp. MMS21-TAE1-1]